MWDHMHTLMHMHYTHAHTHTHKYPYTKCIQTNTHTHKYPYTHAFKHTYTHKYPYVHAHKYTHTHTHNAHIYTNIQTHAQRHLVAGSGKNFSLEREKIKKRASLQSQLSCTECYYAKQKQNRTKMQANAKNKHRNKQERQKTYNYVQPKYSHKLFSFHTSYPGLNDCVPACSILNKKSNIISKTTFCKPCTWTIIKC